MNVLLCVSIQWYAISTVTWCAAVRRGLVIIVACLLPTSVILSINSLRVDGCWGSISQLKANFFTTRCSDAWQMCVQTPLVTIVWSTVFCIFRARPCVRCLSRGNFNTSRINVLVAYILFNVAHARTRQFGEKQHTMPLHSLRQQDNFVE